MPHAGGLGPCVFHDPTAASALSEAKRQFLDLFGTGQVGMAAACRAACGVDVRTLLRWRREDPDFDAQVLQIRDDVDQIQVERVEESYVDRLERGECSGVEMIFYLKNRGKGRWKDVSERQHTGKDGKTLSVLGIRDLLSADDDDEPPPVAPPPGTPA